MTPFVFVHVVQNNEVLVGTVEEIEAVTGEVMDRSFKDMQKLVQALQLYRSQEIIITFLSYPSVLQEEWEKDACTLEKAFIYVNHTNIGAKLK
ncbi:hypothetical protein ATL39_3057 [Sinobaca qinghaiensis]|uniref:Uncharacterized protein n=1 Tax=Sinobaca qinghaiensis TaxID=342944 RepID=A0A419UWW3_9BACL|nr:hypothetical protein [Sinobaca qinghaiensis]RKD69633.1 hypothetical protein ATL39_3057 [Sinobaca qinghaiensis]